MTKFKKGDIIVGDKESDKYYTITNKSDGGYGKIIDIIGDSLIIEWFKKEKIKLPDTFTVNSNFFKKKNNRMKKLKERLER